MKTQVLDHRWGSRARLDLPAELEINNRLSAISKVRDASLTGAFVETRAQPSLLARVRLRPFQKAGVWLDAHVVRVEDVGVALEWCDPGLEQLAVLRSWKTP